LHQQDFDSFSPPGGGTNGNDFFSGFKMTMAGLIVAYNDIG